MFKLSKLQSRKKRKTSSADSLSTIDISRAVPGYRVSANDAVPHLSEEEKAPEASNDASSEMATTLAQKHEAWLRRDLERLSDTWAAARLNVDDDHKTKAFARAVHNLKGMGGSYGYPAISEISKSLEALIKNELLLTESKLVNLHLAACNAAAKEQRSTDGTIDVVSQSVCDALQQQVGHVTAAKSKAS